MSKNFKDHNLLANQVHLKATAQTFTSYLNILVNRGPATEEQIETLHEVFNNTNFARLSLMLSEKTQNAYDEFVFERARNESVGFMNLPYFVTVKGKSLH